MYNQVLKEKINRRFRNVIDSDYQTVDNNLFLFLSFLKENSITKTILDELMARKIYNEEWTPKGSGRGIGGGVDPNLPNNEIDYASLSLARIEDCVNEAGLVAKIGMRLNRGKERDNIRYFNKVFTKTLYDYVNERILEGNLVLYYLMKYKARCEWFYQDELYDSYKSNPRRGEYLLTEDLRSYLFDQGIENPFSEPLSKSGKPDLVNDIGGDNPLTLEIKLFNPDSSYDKSYIRKGVRQAYEYSEDYNQPYGYLLIYNISDYNIKFNTKTNSKPVSVEFGDKTIFIIVVNLLDDGKTASKKGKMKLYQISEDYLTSSN